MSRLRPYRRVLSIIGHMALVAFAYFTAYALRFDFQIPRDQVHRFVETLPYLLIVRLLFFHRFGLFRGYWAFVGSRDLRQLLSAVTLGSITFVALLVFVGRYGTMPLVVPILDWLVTIMLTGGIRFFARWIREEPFRKPSRGQRTLLRWIKEEPFRRRPRRGRLAIIVGAGQAGERLLRQLQHDPRHPLHVVGLVDDNPAKYGRTLHGVPVLGGSDELRRFVAMHHAQQIVIAIPSATPEQIRRLVARAAETGVAVKILPPQVDLLSPDEPQINKIRDVQVEDLLGRPPVQLDLKDVAPELAGKVILVTGAGGSIGSELVRQIARFNPRRLLLLDRAESPLYFIYHEISDAHPAIDVVPVLASVTNAARLDRMFETYRPDCVFHAAAYKHVPMLEWNMIEGVWNNVVGTLRLAQSAARVGTRKFVLISTDKAVNPMSILGATKRVAEHIVRELPSLRSSDTDFRVVRFGNVLGSDGSVVPLFKRQIASGGPVTVTHPEMKRFLMTIPEAAQLVLEAAALPEAAGRIAVLEMGTQVRILELAEQMIRLSGLVPYHDVQIVFTGLRPGEKLEEELVAPDETLAPTSVEKIRVVAGNGAGGATLARQIRSLIAVTGQGDERAVVRALTAIVSEYQPEPLELLPLRRNGSGGHLRGRTNGNGQGAGQRRRITRPRPVVEDLAPTTTPLSNENPEPAPIPPAVPPAAGGALAGGGGGGRGGSASQ
ncbi:MAG TPA: nucleoside-diphosphate sugar epimerase/dehydratase [Gemmatimonadales bacterium]|nr:nucleoside-diphosphate sugar epimerase/dehydratase [Gemmatimonadales bacterium]